MSIVCSICWRLYWSNVLHRSLDRATRQFLNLPTTLLSDGRRCSQCGNTQRCPNQSFPDEMLQPELDKLWTEYNHGAASCRQPSPAAVSDMVITTSENISRMSEARRTVNRNYRSWPCAVSATSNHLRCWQNLPSHRIQRVRVPRRVESSRPTRSGWTTTKIRHCDEKGLRTFTSGTHRREKRTSNNMPAALYTYTYPEHY